MQRQWSECEKGKQAMLAVLRADIINFGMRGPEKPVRPEDLMPKWNDERPKPRRRISAKQRQQVSDSFRRLFGLSDAAK